MSAAFNTSLEPDEAHIARKAQLLQPIALGAAAILAIGFLFIIIDGTDMPFAILLFGATLMSLVGWWFGRQQRVWIGTALIVIAFSSVTSYTVITAADANYAMLVTLPFALLQLSVVALLLNSRSVIVVTVIAVLLSPMILLFPRSQQNTAAALSVFILSFLATGGIIWLMTRQFERTLHAAAERSHQLIQSEALLQEQADQLREQSLAAETGRQEAVRAFNELQTTTRERDQLARSLQEATLPLLPVHHQVLVMPLIGTVDTSRAALLNEAILRGIEEQRARAVIIDVTGVPVVDTQVAGAILRAAEAARLLGAYTILVGIRPEVAQTIVGLGVDLSDLTVRSDLESGIKIAMRLIDQRSHLS